jgi:hypothetical protein
MRVSLAWQLLGRVFRDTVSNLEVDSFPRGGPAVDERNKE